MNRAAHTNRAGERRGRGGRWSSPAPGGVDPVRRRAHRPAAFGRSARRRGPPGRRASGRTTSRGRFELPRFGPQPDAPLGVLAQGARRARVHRRRVCRRWHESALRVTARLRTTAVAHEHLARHPPPGVAREPGDEAGGVVRLAPAAHRFQREHGRVRRGVGVAGVGRAGIHRVHRDAARRQVRGEARRDLVQRPLRRDVGQLAGHRAAVLARGHEHHPPGPGAAGGELLDQQQRRPGVDGVGEVQLRGGELLQRRHAAAGVVGDERVDPAERALGGRDELGGRVGVGEVRGEVLDTHPGAEVGDDGRRTLGIGTPGLLRVVRAPRVQEEVHPGLGQPPRDGRPDPDPPRHPGDHRNSHCATLPVPRAACPP